MAIKCNKCNEKNAILKRPKNGDTMCKECFFKCFEDEVHRTIIDSNLFQRGDRVGIGASGGKGKMFYLI
jgi:cytoplasmic tRNA 2-thiolation protein 1